MNLETKLDPRLWDAIRKPYEDRNFTGAILDASYFLSDLLRERTGLDGDGVPLVGQAFGGSAPKLRVTPLQSESDWSVQRGVEQMLRGLYQAIRNPRSQGKVVESEEDSQAIIFFINYMAKLIGQSSAPFSKTTFLSRVFDPDFVASKRYAELLVGEIPAKKRSEVFFDVYREKASGKGEHLKFFFAALLGVLDDDEKRAVSQAISDELKSADDWPRVLAPTKRMCVARSTLMAASFGESSIAGMVGSIIECGRRAKSATSFFRKYGSEAVIQL